MGWDNSDQKLMRELGDRLCKAAEDNAAAMNRLADILEKNNKETTDDE